MSLGMRVLMVLSVAVLLAVAYVWIKTDMDAWAETTVLTMDEPEEKHVVIKPGDTLWSIARREYGGAHTGKMVHEIRTMNPGIDPGRLQIGQKVRVP